jgi:hypothetical protein
VYAELLRAGMCNRFFAWAYAVIYSDIHQTPYAINGWYKTQIGPWLRRERVKRFYAMYFKDQSDITGYLWRKWFTKKRIMINPGLRDPWPKDKYQTVVFNSIPHSSQYFDELKGYNRFLKEKLNAIIAPGIRKKIEAQPPPQIGVHIRRGDFTLSHLVEELSYFKKAIHYIRQHYGPHLNAVIFTDGYAHELTEVLSLPHIWIYQGQSDIEELMVLSRSRFIVTSYTSTFSYWAAYLSDAMVFHSAKYQDPPVRWQELRRDADFLIEIPPAESQFHV